MRSGASGPREYGRSKPPTGRTADECIRRAQRAPAPRLRPSPSLGLTAAFAALRNRLPGPIPLGTLPSRISALDESGVQALLDFEREHGNRLPVVQVLERRIESLQGGTQPSGAVEQDMPEVTRSSTGSAVSPGTSDAPKINPPSQGVPTNPAQPR